MDTVRELIFDATRKEQLSVPARCTVNVSCFEQPEIQQAVTIALEESLYAAAYAGINITALDGITVATDCRAAAYALQSLPEGQVPLEVSPQPESMELARTAAVRRDGKLLFHIVLRPGLALMALSPEKEMQRLVQACIAHEAAHVEHESHLYRMFPESYGKPLECGNRSRQTFLKSMDVWSEYAACRSSAAFRPEALEDFEGILCRAIQNSSGQAAEQIKAHREGRSAVIVFREIQQIFGDVFIYAGYLLGHVHGLEQSLRDQAPQLSAIFLDQPHTEELVTRLERTLHELWLKEFVWKSIDVFAPIYDLICEMMAQQGLVFVRHEEEWRIVMYDDREAAEEAQKALDRWTKPPMAQEE
ncbi:MAG: hypothetical protein HIU91_09625 [Acidobacteria bacterium]|nr:hypothetical protein [Acidobacteriota bacterium]